MKQTSFILTLLVMYDPYIMCIFVDTNVGTELEMIEIHLLLKLLIFS